MENFNYNTLVARNSGYVSIDVQERIKNTRLLIAGCGVGSSVAVSAARMGFQNFILVDGDIVDLHNLNRQFYSFADVGKFKADSLKNKILEINPEANVQAVNEYLNAENTEGLVKKADIIFDTVDFLALEAILSLHLTANSYNIPILTALNIGFGAGVCFFPGKDKPSLVNLISKDIAIAKQNNEEITYAQVFGNIISRIAVHLDKEVVEQIKKSLTIMEDGKPCPASQLSIGTFTLGALAISMIHDYLAGESIPLSPNMLIHSFKNHTTKLVDLGK